MEKISNIVRGSSRVGAVDMKKELPVRPGTPAFGRSVGESPESGDRFESTASKAIAIQTEQSENRRAHHDQVVEQMADRFFMNRTHTLEEDPKKGKVSVKASAKTNAKASEVEPLETEEIPNIEVHEAEMIQPSGFTPRGSYVNVHA